MKNFIQMGEGLDLTAPTGGVVSGGAYLIGGLLAIAIIDAADGEIFSAQTIGVFSLPKASEDITEGSVLYWDNTNGNLTTTASGNYRVGIATVAAATGDANVEIRLDGVSTIQES